MKYLENVRILRERNRIEAESYFSANAKSVYLGGNRAICIVLGRYKMFVDTNDIGFTPHMLFDGYWEYWLTKFVSDNIKSGDHVLDIGANLGYYSLLMSELIGEEGIIYSIEPNPEIFSMMTSTMILNGFANRAKLLNYALTDSEDESETSLFIPANDPKNAAVVPESYTDPRGRTVKVPSINVRALNLKRVDFIKIDVEGSEKPILESLQAIKEEFKPKIVVEINFGRGYRYDDIVNLVGYGGELLHVNYDGNAAPLTRKMAADERPDQDWLVYWPGKHPASGRRTG